MSASTHDYSVFGLRVRSSIALPELFRADRAGEPDVFITEGAIASADHEEGAAAVDGGLLINVTDVGRFFIANGTDILVEPKGGVDPRNVRLYLLGSAFGALLHQRGLLPLHANAVGIDGAAFAFMGHSGAGKSTLAAWFHDRGQAILADDVCVVRFDGTRPLACPGLPRLRLWLDALELTGRDRDRLSRSYIGASADLDKFDVPVSEEGMLHSALPLEALYLLAKGPELRIQPLEGVEAARAIFENTYRGAYVRMASTSQEHWQSSIALARHTKVFRVERSMNLNRFESEGEQLMAHMRAISSAGQ